MLEIVLLFVVMVGKWHSQEQPLTCEVSTPHGVVSVSSPYLHTFLSCLQTDPRSDLKCNTSGSETRQWNFSTRIENYVKISTTAHPPRFPLLP